jgi:flagellar biosynthetic protein FliQ
MTITEAVYHGQLALLTVGLVCGPVLLVALLVGGVVSLLQAVTQLQEMTVVFVPKILAVLLVLAILGPWMFEQVVTFGTFCFSSVGDVTR